MSTELEQIIDIFYKLRQLYAFAKYKPFYRIKPPAEQREALKARGLHWAPSEDAWQRQLNGNAIYAASYLPFLSPADGSDPMKLQPKAPHKESHER